MKHNAVPILATCSVILMLAASTMCPAQDSAGHTPLKATVALEKSTVMVGEPIVLRWEVSNPSDRDIHANLGDSEQRSRWLSLELRGPDGKAVAPTPDHRPQTRVPCTLVYGLSGAHDSDRGTIIVNQRVSPPKPSRYRLVASGHFPYLTGQESPEARLGEEGEAGVFDMQWSLDLTVTKPGARKLARLSRKLAADVIGKAARPSERDMAIQLLFSMREEDALPAWQQVMDDTNLGYPETSRIDDELLRIGTPAAADLMARRWKTGGSHALVRMWWAGGTGDEEAHRGDIRSPRRAGAEDPPAGGTGLAASRTDALEAPSPRQTHGRYSSPIPSAVSVRESYQCTST